MISIASGNLADTGCILLTFFQNQLLQISSRVRVMTQTDLDCHNFFEGKPY